MLPIALFLFASDDALTRLATLPHRPGGAQVSAMLVGSTGLDGSETLARDPSGVHRGGAITARSAIAGYSYDRGVVVRMVNTAQIGGGASDRGAMFQGGLSFSLMGGYRLAVTPRQGPFVRAGFLGMLEGNDLYYRSALVLPDAHVGYQYLLSRVVLAEVAWTSGLILTGRSDAGGASRDLDVSWATGAVVALHTRPVSLAARWMHVVPSSDSPGPVSWVEGSLCAEPGETLAVCVRGLWNHADVPGAPGTTRTIDVAQVGLTLGTQQRKRLHGLGLY